MVNAVHKAMSSRYYLPESTPLALCGACLIVVLQSSGKAREIYSKIVESYKLPGIQSVSKAVDVELPRRERRSILERNLRDLSCGRACSVGSQATYIFMVPHEVLEPLTGCSHNVLYDYESGAQGGNENGGRTFGPLLGAPS